MAEKLNLGRAVPKKGIDYWTEADKSEINAESQSYIAKEIAKKTQLKPEFANSVAELEESGDTSKLYVLPDGYIYAYRDGQSLNYNLFKISEVTFQSRLTDDTEEIVSSTAQNIVTGWFPVTYGKYYSPSVFADDLGARVNTRISYNRAQLKLADGTIKLYALKAYPSTGVSGGYVFGVDATDAVYMRMQIQINASATERADISTAANLAPFEPMIVAGDTAEEAYQNSTTFDYLDGDAILSSGWVNTGHAFVPADYEDRIVDLEKDAEELQEKDIEIQKKLLEIQEKLPELQENDIEINTSMLYEAQKYVADDWRIPFIDVFHKLGLGANHIVPNSYNIWGGTGNDLTQKAVMMSDGVHPSLGDGVTMMYAQAIIPQLKTVPPLYSADSDSDDWTGKTILWMGTSVPAGSDPALGVEGIGTTYPAITANKLGATCVNIAKGSSCVRINSSAGNYEKFAMNHILRALSRTTDEADLVQANWDSIKANVTSAYATISDDDVATMKEHSFETILLPYLNGTYSMPDLFVIDHGHNDIRPRGVDGEQDSLVKPTVENITNGILAKDTYMTDNNYANLKIALNNDLSRIEDVEAFAASLNRNCLIGAINFIITLIYSYNPRARIAIISDYN